MVAFVVHTMVGPFKNNCWKRFTTVFYKDENRVINTEDERKQALHELYQHFNSHCMGLTAIASAVIGDQALLFKTGREEFMRVMWLPVYEDERPETILQSFHLYTSLDGIDENANSVKEVPEQYWYDYAHDRNIAEQYLPIREGKLEVSSPWKKLDTGL